MENQGQKGFSFGELLKRLTVLIKPHRKRAAIVAVLLLATLGLELAQPLIIGEAVNAVKEGLTTPELKAGALKRLAYFGGLLLAASALRCVMMFVTGVEQTHLTQNILWTLRRRLYDAMQRLSFSFFDNAQSGQLITRSTSDVQRVARFFNAAFFSSIEALTILIGISIYMFHASPLLAVVALAPMPFTFLVVIRAAIKIRPLFREARDSYGSVTSALQENIAGIKVVRAFAKEEQEIDRFGDIAETFISKLLSAIDRWAVRMPLAMFIYRLSGPLVLLVGGYLVMKGSEAGGIDVGVLFAFILYSRLMMWRVHMVGNIVSATTRASAAAERIYEILETDPDVAENRKVS